MVHKTRKQIKKERSADLIAKILKGFRYLSADPEKRKQIEEQILRDCPIEGNRKYLRKLFQEGEYATDLEISIPCWIQVLCELNNWIIS